MKIPASFCYVFVRVTGCILKELGELYALGDRQGSKTTRLVCFPKDVTGDRGIYRSCLVQMQIKASVCDLSMVEQNQKSRHPEKLAPHGHA